MEKLTNQTINITEEIKKAMEKALKERGIVNILIAGRTGVGKSTLINSIFQGNLATTGQGRPVTKNTREIKKRGIPVTLFDTRGLELKDFKSTIGELEKLIKEKNIDEDPKKHIHLSWICISEDSRRVEPAESELSKMLSLHMPVIGVITKARSDEGFRSSVQKLLPDSRNVIRIRAINEKLDDGHELKAFGLNDLIELTMELAPEGQKSAFAAAQKISINIKKNSAHKIVFTAAGLAATAGASPIPFSDAAILIPIQIGMLSGITSVFGIELSKAFLSTLISSILTAGGATLAGRTIVSNLLKFIPGVGTITGGIISATTAAAITTAFGEAYITTLSHLFEKNDGLPPSEDEILVEFKSRYNKKKNK